MIDYTIRPMSDKDAAAVIAIFAYGMETKNATFDKEVPDWSKWNASYLPFSRLVLEHDQQVLGWAAIKPISPRNCFVGVAEVSIYLHQQITGKGLGKYLLEKLVLSSEENGIWSLQSAIFPENIASLNIHYRCGFREIGKREKIAQLDGIWRDVVLLERRSQLVSHN